MWYLIAAEILICGITTIEFLWKFTSKIQNHAKRRLEEIEKDIINFRQSTWYHRTKEDIQVFPRVRIKTNGEIDITHILVPESKLISQAESQVLIARQLPRELNVTRGGIGKECEARNDSSSFARRGTVNEIARKFEKNDSKIKVHTASSSCQQIAKSYFEGPKTIKEPIKGLQHFESIDNDVSDESDEISEYSTPSNTSEIINNEEDCNLYLNGDINVDLRIKSQPIQNGNTSRGSTSPVDTIEDILAQQRFSRTLSAYSITDLIKDIPNDIDIDEFINSINK